MTSVERRLDTLGANVDVLLPLSLPPIIKTASFHKLNKYQLQGVVERLVFKSPSFFQRLTPLFHPSREETSTFCVSSAERAYFIVIPKLFHVVVHFFSQKGLTRSVSRVVLNHGNGK